jgi:ribosomal protein S18 acetylase RimI-like enzyme
MSIALRILKQGDEEILTRVAEGVFDNPIDPLLAAEFLADPRHHLVVAISDDTVIGFVSGVHYVHPDKLPQLWINEVSVQEGHRNQGIGKRLITGILNVGRAHSCTEAWVLTDRQNSAAIKLYTSTGGIEGADQEGPPDATIGFTFRL